MWLRLLVACCFGVPGLCNAQSAGVVRDQSDLVVGVFADARYVHSTTGYRANFDFRAGRIDQVDSIDVGGGGFRPALIFQGLDCVGTPHFRVEAFPAPVGGVVLNVGNPYLLYFAAKGSSSTQLMMQSRREYDGNCVNDVASAGMIFVVPAQLNDPVITGFPNSPFNPPLRVELEPLSAVFDLFSDGFEGALIQQAPSWIA
jgi:hypothetical protein